MSHFPFGIMDIVKLLKLNVRRTLADSVYVDCPFCGDTRGKMNVNFAKNVWRCNYCGEHGGMLELYAKAAKVSDTAAYNEVMKALPNSERGKPNLKGSAQSPRAPALEIHRTYSELFKLLTLTPTHKEHLKSPKRGLSDAQIAQFGFKSTPPKEFCKKLTADLIKSGCRVQGVPGFYLHADGYWTVNFSRKTAGILIPAVSWNGLICGIQILLDVPIKPEGDTSGKAGAKYIWLSSSSKNMGISSGSPLLFIGNTNAKTVYVTEGLLKGYISHALTGKTFIAAAGANNMQQIDTVFEFLKQNGTTLIVEALDMDKLTNPAVRKGAEKIYLAAQKYGLECKRLVWDTAYKGFDDWQLHLRETNRVK